jgi:hypothetical protein
MAIRRINSTGRKKILREDARFLVRTDADGVLSFHGTLNLTEYGLPEDGQVFVEAYRQTTFMRFPHGTVALPEPPPDPPRQLTEFATRDGLRFRVKVTSTGERAGLLLAEGDSLPASDDEEHPEDRIPLLPPAPGDLGQETWRVDFSGADGPLLLINSRLGDWKAVAGSPVFRSLVYPAAMRQVLWHVYNVRKTPAMDDDQDWGSRWLSFAAALPGADDPPLDSDDDDGKWQAWIDGAVESFSRKHRMLDRYGAFLTSEASA